MIKFIKANGGLIFCILVVISWVSFVYLFDVEDSFNRHTIKENCNKLEIVYNTLGDDHTLYECAGGGKYFLKGNQI